MGVFDSFKKFFKSRLGQALFTGALLAASIFTGGATLGVALMWGAGAAAVTYAMHKNPDRPGTGGRGDGSGGTKIQAGIRPRFYRYGHLLADGHCVWLETFENQHSQSRRITERVRERIPGTGGGDDDPQYRYVTRTRTITNMAKTTSFAYMFNVSYGEIDAITGIWIQGIKVPIVRDPDVLNRLHASRDSRYWRRFSDQILGPTVEIYEFFGPGNRAARSPIVADVNTKIMAKNATGASTWGPTDLCTGYSQVMVLIHQPKYGDKREDQMPDDDKLTGRFWQSFIAPRDILFEMRGRKITWPGQTSPVYTENTACIYRDFLINVVGEPASRIDTAMTDDGTMTEFEQARRRCDEMIRLDDLEGWMSPMPRNIRRYTAALDYESGESLRGVYDDLDITWSGQVIDAGGQLHFRPGIDRTPRVTITDDIVVEGGAPVIRPAPSQNERVNVAQLSLKQNAFDDFKAYVVPDIEDTAAIARDMRRYERNFGELRCVTNSTRAAILATTALRESRNMKTLTITVLPGDNWEYWSLIPTDAVNLNLARGGISNEKWEVATIRRNAKDYTVELILLKWAPNRYSDNLVLPDLPTPPPQDLDFVPTPTGITSFAGAEFNPGSAVPRYSLRIDWDSAPAHTVVYIEQAGGANPQNSGTVEGDSFTFRDLPPGDWNIRLNHIGNDGESSARAEATANVDPNALIDTVTVERPRYVSQVRRNHDLQLNFAAPLNVGLAGMDVRYSYSIDQNNQNLPALTADNWNDPTSRRLVTYSDVPTPGVPLTVFGQVSRSGSYRLFARYRHALGALSDVVEIGYIPFNIALTGGVTQQMFPEFMGELTRTYVWEQGVDNWLIPDYGPPNAATIDQWNGVGGWPFGDASEGTYLTRTLDFDEELGGGSRQLDVSIAPQWVGNGAELTTPFAAQYTAPVITLESRTSSTASWVSNGAFAYNALTGGYSTLRTAGAVSQVRVRVVMNATGSNLGLRRLAITANFVT